MLDVKERRLQPTSSESDSIVRAFLCPTQRTSPGSLTPRVSGVSNARAAPKEVEIKLHTGSASATRGEASQASAAQIEQLPVSSVRRCKAEIHKNVRRNVARHQQVPCADE